MVRVLHILHREIATSRLRHVQRLVSSMNEHGHACAVCSLAACERERARQRRILDSSGSALSFCPQSHAFDAAFLFRFAQQINDAEPDVIHVWGRERNPLLQLANRIFGHRPLMNTLDHEECVVAVPQDSDSGQPECSLRSHLGLPENAKLIAARTDLEIRNRGKDLIWALDCLRVLHRDAHLVFFGDGSYQPQLEEYSAQANADQGVVHFVSERERDTDAWIADCDLFWTADSTGDLVSVVEAMHFGIPIIAADIPATRSAIVEGESGFLVPVGDAAEFARRTNVLLSDTTLIAKIRSSASERAVELFGVEAMVQHYSAKYERVLRDHGRAA